MMAVTTEKLMPAIPACSKDLHTASLPSSAQSDCFQNPALHPTCTQLFSFISVYLTVLGTLTF